MNEIGERLKYLRKDILKVTQDTFANRLKFSRGFLANLEKGDRGFTDRTLSDICREFNVSEDWLRNGEGEIFIAKSTDTIDQLCEENDLDALGRNILTRFINSDDYDRTNFINYMSYLTENFNNSSDKKEITTEPESFTEPFTILEQGETYSTILVKNEDLEIISQTLIDDDLVNARFIARGGEKGSVMVRKSDISKLKRTDEDL